MSRKCCAIATALLVIFLARSAAGEPLRLRSPSTVKTDGASELRLPPGYFLEESDWNRLDLEVKRLQDAETRLTVENKTLTDGRPGAWAGWETVAGAFLLGTFAGWVAFR
jgi:hypothetical protein